jgi:hypothetical protein
MGEAGWKWRLARLAGAGYFHRVTPTRHPRDLRASDADRERVVAVLAGAVADGRLTTEEHGQRVHRAYAARTLGDLAVLTRDLAPPGEQPLRLDDPRAVAALFTTVRRGGRWIVPGRLVVTAVGGQVVLDLREAMLAELHTIVHATLIGGRLTVLAPPEVKMAVTQLRLPGPRTGPGRAGTGPRPAPGRGAAAATTPSAPHGTPLIEVRALTVAGRVRVVSQRRAAASRWLGGFRRRDR